jgi:hypothetical protein
MRMLLWEFPYCFPFNMFLFVGHWIDMW